MSDLNNNTNNNTVPFTGYPAFAGLTVPTIVMDSNFSYALMNNTNQEEDPNMYFPQYHLTPQFPTYYQPYSFTSYDAQVPQQQQPQQQDTELDFMSDYFVNRAQSPATDEVVVKNEQQQPQQQYELQQQQQQQQQFELQPQPTQPIHNVALSQNMLEQIMTATEDNNANILEMLRSKIKAAMQPQTEEAAAVLCDNIPVVVDTRPVVPLHTELIHQEKQDEKKKGGITKKRRYVKSGLYRKDKNGNFIFSSSDRAKMAQNQDEQQDTTENTQGTRVKRPLNAYNIFCKMHFDQVKRENPEMSINELSKLMGEKWKGMNKNEKKAYYDKVEHGQTRYKKPLNSYNLFCKKNFDALKKEFPNRSIHILSKIIAERWKKLSESEKKIYYDEAERQKQSEEFNQHEQYQQQHEQYQQQQQHEQYQQQHEQLYQQQQHEQQFEQPEQQQFLVKDEYQSHPTTIFQQQQQPLTFDGAEFDLFL